MGIVLGLMLIPVVIAIIKVSNLLKIKKQTKVILNLLLVIIAIGYLVCCIGMQLEPFNFGTTYSTEYMLYTGEYLLNAGVIFVFSPALWIIVFHFSRMIYLSLKVRKNAIIKKDNEFIYYRGDLEKVSPSIIMFTSTYEVDIKKSISSTILKLKIMGYIKENEDTYTYTNKDVSSLLESEKMVLDLIKSNEFDKNEYRKIIEKETIENKYLVKNGKGKLTRLIKIGLACCIPFVIFSLSTKLDDYTHENYNVWPEDDGHCYIRLELQDDVEELYEEVEDKDDYYHSLMYNGRYAYSYDTIRADKLEYGIVRKAFFLNILTVVSIGFTMVSIVIAVYIVVEQLAHINKNYRRTIKGKKLLNKAYALKNYLKKYSLIKTRTEKELVLWEYYLVYAVLLDVNEKLEDKIIEKYVRNIV